MDIEDMKDQQLDEETLNDDDPISAAFTRIISSQLASMQEGLEAIGKAISGALEKIYTNIASIGDAFTKAIAQIENNTRVTVSNLAEKGWYCDLGKTRTQFFDFLSKVVTDDDVISEENIIKYYRENLDQIKANLMALYPHRKKFIEKGFQSHNDSDFISSIPIFLMFTDGISFEKIEVSVFASKEKQLRIKTGYTNNLDINEIQRATLLAITEYWTVNAREDGEHDSEINRHRILHGKSLDYDTEINSLKMISFANYVAGVFNSWPTSSKPQRIFIRTVDV
jgi:hypothetical protein